MLSSIRYFLLFLWLCYFVPVAAQQTLYREFTINNGLPHTDAYCTVQDNKGFLWFATLDGLCRYDGNDIVIYRNDHSDLNSISNNRIIALEFDSKRNGMWIGTQAGGVNFMDLVKGRFHKIEIKNSGHLVREVISVKLIDSNVLWVGTPEGLFAGAINDEKPGISNFTKIPLHARTAQAIFEDKNKGIWVGTLNELYYKPPGKVSFRPLHTDLLKGIYSVVAYDDMHLLAGTLYGLFEIDLENFSIRKLNNLKIISLLVDKPGSIWAGTFSEGLFHCKADGSAEQSYLFGTTLEKHRNVVKNIFKDRSSSIFASTLGGGIKVFNENNYTFRSYPLNIADKELSHLKKPLCFYADNNSILYIGTKKMGLAVYNRITNKVNFISVAKNIPNSMAANEVTAIFKDHSQTLWVGKGKNLYFFENANLSAGAISKPYFERMSVPFGPSRINKIIEDKKGCIWVVTSRGIYCYSSKKDLLFNSNSLPAKYSSLNSDYLNDIILHESGNVKTIWLASKSGLSRLKLNKDFSIIELKKFTSGPSGEQLFSNWISLLHEDQEHNIWAGTIGGGLSKVRPLNNGQISFATVTTKNGLLTNDIETLLEDTEGNFWIGSIGLTKYNTKKKTFSYYDANDGLQSNAFKVWSAFKRPDGEMIFGGINGFNIFYPQNIRKKTEVFKPQLTNLLINNNTVKPGNEIEGEVLLQYTLPYTSEITLNNKIRNFGLEFASIHSHDFKKIVYKYRLLGYDKQWAYTNSTKRFVNYIGLPAGDYVFQLFASGGDGIYSRPLELNIHIMPSFWQSIYGYMLYASVIIGGLLLQRRYTLIRLDIKHKLQLDKSKQDQEIKLYEDKVDFFTNISHELRTPLTLITSPVEQLLKFKDLPKAIDEKLNIIHANAERLKALTDQILDIRKLELGKINLHKENINISMFLKNISIQFHGLFEKKNIRFSLDAGLDQNVCVDIFKMEQVLINLLNNALKFTPENKEVKLRSYCENGFLFISVNNAGAGINAENHAKIFEAFYQVNVLNRQGSGLGLTISKYLVELHGGTIDVHSAIDACTNEPFTCFTVKLPAILEEVHIQDEIEEIARPCKIISQDNCNEYLPAIILVEDNEELMEILKEEFNSDYKVFTACNGKEALKIIRKYRPSIIITDIMMPEMDGIELCRAVKGDLSINDIPVVMLTAKDTRQSRSDGFEAMADDYISKPFNLHELHLKVRNMVLQRTAMKNKLNNDIFLNPSTTSFMARDERILKDVIAIVEKNIDSVDFSVEQLCKDAAISRPVLYRKIKELTGISIQLFILDIRLKRAAQLLRAKSFTVSEVMYKTGFSSPSYFNKAFKNKYHSSPTHYNEVLEN